MKKTLVVASAALLVLGLTGCGKTSARCDSAPSAASSGSTAFVPVRPPIIPPRVYVPPVRPVAPAPRPGTAPRPVSPGYESPSRPFLPYWVPFFGSHGSTSKDCKK